MTVSGTDAATPGDLIRRLTDVVGTSGIVTAPAEMAGYLTDWRSAYAGAALAVVRPASTEAVAGVMRLCHQTGTAVVPQGGNTGMCGGAVPDSTGRQLLVSLTRMRRIRDVDVANQTITAEAGAVLQAVQEAAAGANKMFPLSLGAQGSCTIGGNLATNAGGTAVLRYGTMRDLTLGLEVVLPDGRIWNGLRALRKDNTGYDLKQLFIGAEGTLGIITAAVLKLFPAVRSRATAWVAIPETQSAVDLIGVVREVAGDRLTGFEIMSRQSVDFVLRHSPGTRDPFADRHRWYALVELSDSLPEAGLDDVIASVLEVAVQRDLIADAAIASSPAQAAALWALREGISEAQNHEGPSLKHDVTVPVSSISQFVERTDRALEKVVPGIRIVTYGHVGDGNLHYNLSKPPGYNADDFRARATDLAGVIYDQTAAFNGSISAEHGLGQSKRDVIADYKDSCELDLMRGLKQLLDPRGLMNPGKGVPD
ncbi:FAD-binding oxidoreductase [Mycobacterium sp. 21AC1]|uniref:FAD-binding oxidoreductase n=1 Tax=[Mycobacterium] appelbergii TaxID=2939269 RepID=UPI0029393E46|nr:FAD-binding oxidoreductase [Mycobacterium sp. 21AC1]MDV3128574.1 FAD-binding oxidoreductase [Mycobacterium sp. 21AC1]